MTTSSPVYPSVRAVNTPPLMRWALPLAGGLLLSLGFPNEILPGAAGDHPPCWIAWLALFPLMWMLYHWPERAARRGAWLYGASYSLGLLSWMRLFGLLPWVLLAGLLSLTIWLAVRLAHCMALPRWLSPLGLACAWTGIEWARSQSMFSFAWGELGASQIDGFAARMASLGSVYLISFLLLLLTGMLTQYLSDRSTPRWFIAVVLGSTLLCLGAGWWQTAQTTSRWRHATRSQVFALVQPCTQRGLNPEVLATPPSYEDDQRRVNTLLADSQRSLQGVTRTPGAPPPLVVWSETALPYPPAQLQDVLVFPFRMQSYLLAGAPYFPPNSDNPYNCAFLFAPNGVNIDRYAKIHLVPFGEFVPLRKLVQSLHYTVRSNDIVPGPAWRPLRVGPHRLGVGICFESTLPDIARTYADQGANYLIYITNDAWFHQTSAVRQHFNHSRFRALETGLPIVRVGGTGISGFIAPDGHSLAEIPVYTEGTTTRSLPEGTPGTIFTRCGWGFGPLCLLASLLLCLRGLWIARRLSKIPHAS